MVYSFKRQLQKYRP